MPGWLLLLLSWVGGTGGHVPSGVFVFARLVHAESNGLQISWQPATDPSVSSGFHRFTTGDTASFGIIKRKKCRESRGFTFAMNSKVQAVHLGNALP